jgi:hypothetical protein
VTSAATRLSVLPPVHVTIAQIFRARRTLSEMTNFLTKMPTRFRVLVGEFAGRLFPRRIILGGERRWF